MQKFEHRLLDVTSGFFSAIDYQQLTERLNVLGEQGWEVVTMVETEFTRNQARGLLITLKRVIS
ncbi:MAG: DUF4177 domain-containing protein [Janthinobacterium lividum]